MGISRNLWRNSILPIHSATFSNSTAIGANSQVTASNQVMLGTVTETVNIPNTISFSRPTQAATKPLTELGGYIDFVNQPGNGGATTFNSVQLTSILMARSANIIPAGAYMFSITVFDTGLSINNVSQLFYNYYIGNNTVYEIILEKK